MSDDREIELLKSIDAKLCALLALAADGHIRETGAKAKPRNTDKLLKAGGLNNTEIAAILGKTRQAVEEQLKKK